jgi:hypothetical protein
MEQLKAVAFYLQEAPWQSEFKERMRKHNVSPEEVVEYGDGKRKLLDSTICFNDKPFTLPFMATPTSYEIIEPNLPPDIKPIVDFEDISLAASEKNIKKTFVLYSKEGSEVWSVPKSESSNIKPALSSNDSNGSSRFIKLLERDGRRNKKITATRELDKILETKEGGDDVDDDGKDGFDDVADESK